MKFIIDERVFEKLPGAIFGVVTAQVDNSKAIPEIAELLKRQTEALKAEICDANLKEHPFILPYREAFQKLGVNPNKFMCSIEALCKRVQKGAELPPINPVVDIGNAMSLKYMLPMGAHDLGKMNADFMVRFSAPGDRFTPFGSIETEMPEPDELVYVSGDTVKTRRWIWRQSEDGKIDETSSRILFPIDGFDVFEDRVSAARDELCGLIAEYFKVTAETGLLTAENLEMDLG